MKKSLYFFIPFLLLFFTNTYHSTAQSGTSGHPYPILVSITPQTVYQGDTVDFTLIVRHAQFTKGAFARIYSFQINRYFDEITHTVINDTTAIFKFCMYYQFKPDLFGICVSTGLMEACFDNRINLLPGSKPMSFTITPGSSMQGQTVNLSVKGKNTRFLAFKDEIQGIYLLVSNTFKYATAIHFINDSLINATFNFDYKDAPGVHTVYVKDLSGAPPLVLQNGFNLFQGPDQPELKSIAPAVASQGITITTIRISAVNTHFLAGMNTVSMNFYKPTAIRVINDTTIDADFIFTYNMVPHSQHSLYLENAIDGQLKLENVFTLEAGLYPPSVKNLSPTFGRRGQTMALSITGKNTYFSQKPVIFLRNDHGQRISPDNITYINDTLINAIFSFSSLCILGKYNVYVYDKDIYTGSTLQNGFTLYQEGASILNVSPSSAVLGETVTLTVQSFNSHYLSGSNTMQLQSIYGGPSLSGSNVTAVNDSLLTATFSFTDANFNGKYTATINNAVDGTIKMDTAITLKSSTTSAHILSLYPKQSVFGYPVTITVKSMGTKFKQGLDTIRLHHRVLSLNLYPTSMHVLNDTMISATFNIPYSPPDSLYKNPFMDVVISGNHLLVLENGFFGYFTVNIPKIEGQQFSVYPNPSPGLFNIHINDESIINEIEVVDVIGRTLLQQEKLSKDFQIDISGYSSDIYYLRLIGTKTSEVVKLIKE